LRVAGGGDTLIPNEAVAKALEALNFPETSDEYVTLAAAENLALHLDLPAPIAGALLEDLARDDFMDYSERPSDDAGNEEEVPKEAEASDSSTPESDSD